MISDSIVDSGVGISISEMGFCSSKVISETGLGVSDRWGSVVGSGIGT